MFSYFDRLMPCVKAAVVLINSILTVSKSYSSVNKFFGRGTVFLNSELNTLSFNNRPKSEKNLLEKFFSKGNYKSLIGMLAHLRRIHFQAALLVGVMLLIRAMIASLSVWLKIDDIFSFSDKQI
jgi:hypothetical protein